MKAAAGRLAVDWAADLCTCGCKRSQHKLGPRGPWPLSLRVIGACTGCACRAWEIDVDALAAAEEADRVRRWNDPINVAARELVARY